MEDYRLLIDLHKNANRQGPGGDAETKMALSLARIDRAAPLKIADIGCGTGASTLLLARLLNARITAVDFLPDFLEVLETNAKHMGLSERITTLACSMDNLPFGVLCSAPVGALPQRCAVRNNRITSGPSTTRGWSFSSMARHLTAGIS